MFAFDVVLRSGLTGYSNPSLVRTIQNTIRAQNVPVRALPMNLGGIYLTNGGHLTDCDTIPSSEPHRPLFTATATLGGYSVVVQTAATSRKSGLKETKEAAVRVLLTDIDVITEVCSAAMCSILSITITFPPALGPGPIFGVTLSFFCPIL